MITIIFGEPGAGKTSLMAHFLLDLYQREGSALLRECRQKVEALNEMRSTPFTLPSKPPIFSDFNVKFLVGYKKYFEPYYINGYYFGMQNDNMPTQLLPPKSKVFLTEGQRYFDSRKSATFPRFVSEAFEMHRHYGLDIYIDVQRPVLIDKNVRELCKRFIEVQGMEHQETQLTGQITATTFHCREFDSNAAVEAYLGGGEKIYRSTTYEHRGNILETFDSYGHFDDFLPKEGSDFHLLPFLGKGGKPPKELEAFYKFTEPKEYRGGAAATKEKKAA